MHKHTRESLDTSLIFEDLFNPMLFRTSLGPAVPHSCLVDSLGSSSQYFFTYKDVGAVKWQKSHLPFR